MKEAELICGFCDFLRKLLSETTPQKTPQHHSKFEHHPKIEMVDIEGMPTPLPSQRSAIATQTELPSTSSTGQITASYETRKRRSSSRGDDDT
jgi:hypothetical protein